MNGMMLKMGTSALKTKMQEKEMDIEWEDYNYPPGLKIIHYNPPEMIDPTKITLAKLMHASFLLLVVFYFLNFTINLLAWIAGDQSIGFFMPLYSIFHMFMIVPLGMGVFSKGYRAMAGISSERTWYKYGEVFLSGDVHIDLLLPHIMLPRPENSARIQEGGRHARADPRHH
jgi:hypothetical protein